MYNVMYRRVGDPKADLHQTAAAGDHSRYCCCPGCQRGRSHSGSDRHAAGTTPESTSRSPRLEASSKTDALVATKEKDIEIPFTQNVGACGPVRRQVEPLWPPYS